MTTTHELPDWPPINVIRLPIASDLSIESLLQADAYFSQDPRVFEARFLVATYDQLTAPFRAWLWDNARHISVVALPALITSNRWALVGARKCVVSQPPGTNPGMPITPFVIVDDDQRGLSAYPLDDLLNELRRRADPPRMVTWQANDILTLLRRKYSPDCKYDIVKGFWIPHLPNSLANEGWLSMREAMAAAGIPNAREAAEL